MSAYIIQEGKNEKRPYTQTTQRVHALVHVVGINIFQRYLDFSLSLSLPIFPIPFPSFFSLSPIFCCSFFFFFPSFFFFFSSSFFEWAADNDAVGIMTLLREQGATVVQKKTSLEQLSGGFSHTPRGEYQPFTKALERRSWRAINLMLDWGFVVSSSQSSCP